MIAYIKGKIAYLDPTFVVIDIQGLGYEIRISLNTFTKIKDKKECQLHTYLHVKEDSHTLFGFFDLNEKNLFLSLISISGIGPNTGLMVNSSLSPSEIKNAILNDDVKTIQSVKGIGGKTAQRIIIELKDKIIKEAPLGDIPTLVDKSHNTLQQEALSALTTLGIPKNTAEKSISTILKSSSNDITLEHLIKLALKGA